MTRAKAGQTAQDKRARKAFDDFDRKVKKGYDEIGRRLRRLGAYSK